MATFDELVATIAQRLGNRRDIIPYIQTEADFVKEHILERDTGLRPWFLISADVIENLGVGVKSFSLPTSFIAEYEDGFIFLNTADTDDPRDLLTKIVYMKGQELFAGATGTPHSYALINRDIFIYPVPAVAEVFTLRYYIATSKLRDTPTNPWFDYGYDLLLARTGQNVATYIQNTEMALLFMNDAKVARARLIGENEERKLTNLNASRNNVL